MSTQAYNQRERFRGTDTVEAASAGPRGPVLPRLDVTKLARHLPELRRIRIEINGVLAGCPVAVPDAVREFAVGWAFANRFLSSSDQLGKISSTASYVSLMIESGADLERLKYEAIGWIPRQDEVIEQEVERSSRTPRSVAMMSEMDAISTCQATFKQFANDGARAGYAHVALASADDVLCVARDVTADAAASKIFGWVISNGIDCAATILVVRGILDHDVLETAARAGIPVVATDAVPTSAAVTAGEASCTTIIGLAMSHRRAIFVDGGHLGDDPQTRNELFDAEID